MGTRNGERRRKAMRRLVIVWRRLADFLLR
jgi:hypothetical protein